MQLHEVCCGLDVHKKSVTACVLWAVGRRRQTREFGTFTRELLELADWLRANNRSRFLFTGPPLRLPGAVGSPATPVATV